MKYEEARNMIESGDVIFITKKRSTIAKLIHFFTRSDISHCAIAFWQTFEDVRRLLLIEAQLGSNRRIVNASVYSRENMTVICGLVPWKDIEREAMERIGIEKYSVKSAILVGLSDFLSKIFKINTNVPDKRGEICSEFVAKMERLSPSTISPGDLYDLMLEKSNVRVCIDK